MMLHVEMYGEAFDRSLPGFTFSPVESVPDLRELQYERLGFYHGKKEAQEECVVMSSLLGVQ